VRDGNSRFVALVRTALIGYGAAALSVLLARSGLQQAPVPIGLVAAGIGLQVILAFARARAGADDTDAALRKQAVDVLELLGDGITVLLFAIATFGAVTRSAAPL
jgi:hypothetical protein